ncbi:hypothetical protein BH23ACT10_BH23ACT10_28670 [soil metagenome]
MWDVTVTDGRATRLRGNAEHPTTRGGLCPKVNRFIDRVYHPDRLHTPLRRTGPKNGADHFEPVGWDEVITEIADRLQTLIDGPGAEAIRSSRSMAPRA